MNILDENGESYFVTAFDHSTQEQGTATSKDAFTGGDINASLTQEVVELREEVAGHGTDQLLYLAGKDSGLVSNDLVDIAVFQDPGIERITLACDTVVEGNDTLLEALYHCQIRMAVAQLQDIDGKAANVNDIGDGMSFQRAELGNGSRKRLGIAEYLADPNRVVLAVILKIHDLAPTQEVLLETAVQLLIVCGRQTHKQGKSDCAEDYPGVFIDFVREDGATVVLACVEYDPDKDLLQTVVYGDCASDEPTAIVEHYNTDFEE